MANVLITGGAGYIGSHTIVELLQAGHDVVVVDNLCNSNKTALDRVEEIACKKIKFYKCDIRDKDGLNLVFEENKIDLVIHFAGLKAVGESVKNPELYFDNNVHGTEILLKAMESHGCKKLIFSSSATVYGVPEKLPLDEECALRTTNPYGETKLKIEYMLKEKQRKDNSWSIVILRYFNPVGAHESGKIGEDPKGIPNNLTPYVAEVAIGKLPYVNVYGNDYDTPDGTGVRDYIHVVDLAKGHLAAMKKLNEKGVFVYNLGTGVGYSVLEVIQAFEKACNKSLPYKIAPRREGDVGACYASARKAKTELGWQAELSLQDMCDSLWKWQSQNPNGYAKD